MTPIPDIRRDAGSAPARTSPRRAAAAACLCLLSVGAGGAALAQQQPEPPLPPRQAEAPSERYWRQPASGPEGDAARRDGDPPSAEERREELRTLNRIYRELMPPGPGTVPAPRLAPEQGQRPER